MKANSLRIGNLIYDKGTTHLVEVFQIDRDSNERNRINYIAIDNYEPILITEEWLLKFGFERIINNWKVLDLVCFTLSWERLAGLALSIENESIYLPHIKYLHQLQNLFFALMGEELTIKGSEQ